MKNREKGNGKREGERKIGKEKWNRNFLFTSAAKEKEQKITSVFQQT